MKIRSFITHKLGEQYSDCQDRFSISEDNHAIAVSDGMSQSIFPQFWAEILSDYYVQNGHCSDDDRKNLCSEWLERVLAFKMEEEAKGRDLWRLQNHLIEKKGAGATLCGIVFENEKKWHGDVLGDSCIIEVDLKGEAPLHFFSSEEKPFDSYPDYYDSFPEKQGRGEITSVEGEISEEKSLLLVTDAFSDYFYRHPESGSEWIKKVFELTTHDDFCSLIDEWRQNGLHDDDSTLCIIEFDGVLDFNVLHADDIKSLILLEQESTVDEVGNQQNVDEVEANEDAKTEKVLQNEDVQPTEIKENTIEEEKGKVDLSEVSGSGEACEKEVKEDSEGNDNSSKAENSLFENENVKLLIKIREGVKNMSEWIQKKINEVIEEEERKSDKNNFKQ